MKLALIGKNISHSKSPEMYKKILGDVDYTLLDFAHENEIPPLVNLFIKYDGISITSPYKQSFNEQIVLTKEAKILNATNCLRKKNNIIEGTNTDYWAIVEILKDFKKENTNLDIVILGDGVMAKTVKLALENLQINYRQLSRKMTKDFSQLKKVERNTPGQLILINCCSRDYICSIELEKNDIFWDFNYSFTPHEIKYQNRCRYFDGLSMLFLQAKYAVEFWSSKI